MITSAPNAPEGSVSDLPRYSVVDFSPADAVLCRNTAPLILFAFSCLRRGIACHVVGKDIQLGLTKLVDKCSAVDLPTFRSKLLRNRESECGRLRRKGKRQQAENYSDKVEALLTIAEACDSVAGIKTKIERLFRDGPGLTLSTIHKSKGLEWSTVFLLDWHLVPSPYAEQDWEKKQERNLQYVAITRAKLHVKYIKSDRWTQ